MAKRQETRIPTTPFRVYSLEELEDFDQKTKRFYVDETQSSGEVLSILDYNELAVAYGAFVKKQRTPTSFCYARAAHEGHGFTRDRKSTRLNSSHSQISYAVFCLKKTHHT